MPLWQLVGGSIPWLVALSGAGVIMLLVIFLLLQWRDRSRLIPGIPYVKPIVPYLGEVGTFLPKPTDFYERNKKEVHGCLFFFLKFDMMLCFRKKNLVVYFLDSSIPSTFHMIAFLDDLIADVLTCFFSFQHGEMFSFTLLGRTVVVFTTVELGMLYWKAPTDVLDLRLG